LLFAQGLLGLLLNRLALRLRRLVIRIRLPLHLLGVLRARSAHRLRILAGLSALIRLGGLPGLVLGLLRSLLGLLAERLGRLLGLVDEAASCSAGAFLLLLLLRQ